MLTLECLQDLHKGLKVRISVAITAHKAVRDQFSKLQDQYMLVKAKAECRVEYATKDLLKLVLAQRNLASAQLLNLLDLLKAVAKWITTSLANHQNFQKPLISRPLY